MSARNSLAFRFEAVCNDAGEKLLVVSNSYPSFGGVRLKFLPLTVLSALLLVLPGVARADNNAAPKILVRYPKPTLALYGAIGYAGVRYHGEQTEPDAKPPDESAFAMGVSGQLGIVATQIFSVQFSGVYRPFHPNTRPGQETIHAFSPEISFHFGSFNAPREAGDATFLTGMAFVVPVGRNDIPMSVAPFIGLDGMAVFRKLSNMAPGLGIDLRVGYRFSTGQEPIRFVDGFYGELRSGLRLDIL